MLKKLIYFAIMFFLGIGYIYATEYIEQAESFIHYHLPNKHLYTFFWLLILLDIIIGTIYLIATGIARYQKQVLWMDLLGYLIVGTIISVATSFIWAIITIIF